MIGMGGVVIGRENSAEPFARPVSDSAKKCTLIIFPIPSLQQGDVPTIGQTKTRNVDGFGAGVFAPPSRTCNFSAGIAAKMFQLSKVAAEEFSCRRANRVLFPKVQFHRERAAGFYRIKLNGTKAGQRHSARNTTRRRRHEIGQAGGDRHRCKRGPAMCGIRFGATNFPTLHARIGQRQIERQPRIPRVRDLNSTRLDVMRDAECDKTHEQRNIDEKPKNLTTHDVTLTVECGGDGARAGLSGDQVCSLITGVANRRIGGPFFHVFCRERTEQARGVFPRWIEPRDVIAGT